MKYIREEREENLAKTYMEIYLRKKKVRNNIRIIFENINGFGVIEPKIKKDLIKKRIKKYNIDIYAMVEVNVNVGKVSVDKTLGMTSMRFQL